jgi:hypothetical protein
MNYLDLLKHAARLFWNTKALWFLGIIAALFGQNDYQFNVNYSQRVPLTTPSGSASPFPAISTNPVIASFLANPLPYLLAIGIVAILWWMIATFIGWLVQGAMIAIAGQANQRNPVSMRTSLRQGRQQAWSLFLLHLVLSIPTLVVVVLAILLIVPLMLSTFRSTTPDLATIFPRLFGTVLCLVPLFLLNGLVGIVLNVLNTFAARCCVLEHLTLRASIRQAWLLLRQNLGYIALNWFVLLLLGALFGVIAAAPALLLLIPAAQPFFNNDWSLAALSALIGLGVYFVVIGLGVGGILTGFNSTVWTVLYQSFQRTSASTPETPATV